MARYIHSFQLGLSGLNENVEKAAIHYQVKDNADPSYRAESNFKVAITPHTTVLQLMQAAILAVHQREGITPPGGG